MRGKLNPAMQPIMNQKRRGYLRDFFSRRGYRMVALSDEEQIWLFRHLARTDEYETDTKYEGLNWEWSFAPIEVQENIRKPTVDIAILEWVKEGKLEQCNPTQPLWPDGKRFALCLTHDIDVLQQFPWRERWRAFVQARQLPPAKRCRAFLGMLRYLAQFYVPQTQRQDFPLDMWLCAEAENGFRSTFFFVPDLREVAEPDIRDCYYRYDDSVIFDGRKSSVGDTVRSIAERSWDVGLHGSICSSTSPAQLRREKASVERASGAEVISNRQHYLRFDVRTTPRYLEEAGFRADSSLGSNIDYGFRAGTGGPFPWYDLEREITYDLIEIPLVVQDNAIIKAVDGNEDLVVKRALEIIDRVAACSGVVTLLWHNNHTADTVQFRSYERILHEARLRGAWGCSIRDLVDWWAGRGG